MTTSTRVVGVALAVLVLAPPMVAAQTITDDFSLANAAWRTGPTAEGTSQISAGVLLIRNETASPLASVVRHGSTFTDVVVEVDMMLVDGTDNNWQTVYCRDTDAGQYSFGVAADGYYNFEVWGRPGAPRLSGSLPPTRHAAIRTGRGAVNRVRVECVGDRLRFSINGTLVHEVRDTRYTSGQIALTVSSVGDSFSTVLFDDVRITRP